MQYLPKDRMRRLRQEQEADTVQTTGRLPVPEQKIKHSLPDMSPEGKEDRGIETQDTQRRTLSRVSLHEMRSLPSPISLSVVEEKRARRHMWKLRTGAMRSMRYYVVPRKLCGWGYSQLLQLRRREAHYMLGLQGTTATCATTTATGTHEQEQATVLHMQASASTHTDMPTPH